MGRRGTQPVRVLIIDDDVMSREVLHLLLETEGFTVASVASGEAAITELGRSEPPDVILADVQMPGLSGVELGHQLRRRCPPGSLFFAMSGSNPSDEVKRSFDLFLLKPFGVSQFAAAIKLCRGRRRTPPKQATVGNPAPDIPSPVSEASNSAMSARTHDPLAPASPRSLQPLAPAAPELDERIYNQLQESLPKLQLQQIYSLCVKDVRKRIAVMRSLATHHDGEQFVREAHAIKGGCGMLGASELYLLATRLEKGGLQAAGSSRVTDVNPLDELSTACDRLERILEART